MANWVIFTSLHRFVIKAYGRVTEISGLGFSVPIKYTALSFDKEN
jgi:hypothetical protein